MEVTLDGETEELDEVFDTRDEAEAFGGEWVGDYKLGVEIEAMRKGYEADEDDYGDCDWEVIEVDE